MLVSPSGRPVESSCVFCVSSGLIRDGKLRRNRPVLPSAAEIEAYNAQVPSVLNAPPKNGEHVVIRGRGIDSLVPPGCTIINRSAALLASRSSSSDHSKKRFDGSNTAVRDIKTNNRVELAIDKTPTDKDGEDNFEAYPVSNIAAVRPVAGARTVGTTVDTVRVVQTATKGAQSLTAGIITPVINEQSAGIRPAADAGLASSAPATSIIHTAVEGAGTREKGDRDDGNNAVAITIVQETGDGSRDDINVADNRAARHTVAPSAVGLRETRAAISRWEEAREGGRAVSDETVRDGIGKRTSTSRTENHTRTRSKLVTAKSESSPVQRPKQSMKGGASGGMEDLAATSRTQQGRSRAKTSRYDPGPTYLTSAFSGGSRRGRKKKVAVDASTITPKDTVEAEQLLALLADSTIHHVRNIVSKGGTNAKKRGGVLRNTTRLIYSMHD